MPRFIRNHPIWFALLALLLAYGLWWLYQDYELTAYPRRVAASIPVPNNTTLVQQKEFINKKCRSSGIILYFASNSSWEEIEEFYKNYFVEPKWVAWVGKQVISSISIREINLRVPPFMKLRIQKMIFKKGLRVWG